jgi:hypothetical protein
VRETVDLLIWRGSQPREKLVEVVVGDLHKLIPNLFISFDGGVGTKFSYQMAIIFDLPVKGVLRCQSRNNNSRYIIEAVNLIKTPNWDAFLKAIKSVQGEVPLPRFLELRTKYEKTGHELR